jgi:CDP-diacylglycerol--glycerol-3-phosphate 3-phosphatidyltransferase
LARQLATQGIAPDALTWLGLALALLAAACLIPGAGDAGPWTSNTGRTSSFWPLLAGAFMFLSGAMDVLDGATARAVDRKSPAGAFLDSTIDRVSDSAIAFACAVHFAVEGNVTLVALAVFSLFHWGLISYVKARGENLIESCGGGYWQRPERWLLFLLGGLLGQVPSALWLLSLAPVLTAWTRVAGTRARLLGHPVRPASWNIERGTLAYDAITAANAAWIAFSPYLHPLFSGERDPLRALLG